MHTSFLFSGPNFFNSNNSLKVGFGGSQCHSILGSAFHAEYTRHVANIIFGSFRMSFASAKDNTLNASYASQEMTSADFLMKINPIMTNRHIVSLNIGFTQSFYSFKGMLNTPAGYVPNSKSENGTGITYGGNYDFLLSRFYFVSIGGGAIQYDATMYYFSLSVGTVF